MTEGTQAEYAQHRGVSLNTVSKACRNGRLHKSVSKKGRKTWINFALADEEWDANSGTARNPFEDQGPGDGASPANGEETMTFNEARTRVEHYKALVAELDYQKRRKELIESEEAAKVVYNIVRVIRDRIFALPPHLTTTVLSAKDEASATLALKKEFHQVFTEASETIEQEFARQ